MRNWSAAGSIRRHFVPSDTLIQAAYLREFVPEFQRRLSGHHADDDEVRVDDIVPGTCVYTLKPDAG
jgi:hypothetical protein